MLNFLITFFLYLFGHCIADTSLQTDAMAVGKNRHREIDLTRVPKGQKPMNLWYMWLTHHAMIHAGIVFFITYFLTHNLNISFTFSVAEIYYHWLIDYHKCENRYSPIGDQILHIIVKILFAVSISF